jgi:flavin reductase (DIM6/NTAB) family NADH-FMN oxidoreductase RutF
MIDPRTFRNALGRLATGVSVVAVEVNDGLHAMTANAVCALSLMPPQVLFCPKKAGRLAHLLPQAERFTVSFLREDQQALSTYFAGAWKEPRPPPFRFVRDHDAPRLEGSLAALVCNKESIHDGGDHLLVVGQVVALHQGLEPQYPLLFFNGKYQTMERTGGKEAPPLTDVTDEPPTVYYHP